MYRVYKRINGELSPIYNTTLIQQVKNEFLKGITYGYIEVEGTETVLTEENYIKNFDISELRFVPNEGVFGQCVAKKIDLNLNNANEALELQDKEITVYLRVIYNEEYYYIKYGTYIIQKPENETTTDNTNVIGLDYMVKANQPYVDEINYPCTLKQLAQYVCGKIGITLAEENFRNENFSVESNLFVEGESYRNVLQGIAKCAFSWARIDEENVLHFDLNKIENPTEEIDYDGYFNLNKQDLMYGPINRVIIRESEIEGENVTIEDAESIAQYGATELVIADNPFGYTQAKREQLINAGSALFGFTYMPINESSLIGYCFLNCIDKIRFTTLNDENIDTYLFNHIISYNGATLDKIETPALTKTETRYRYIPGISESVKRTEIIVDKQNGVITEVVEDVGKQNQKIAKITQDIAEIKSEIQDIADITISDETTIASLSMEDINESEPVRIVIHPIGTNISYLYPRTNLFPSSSLFMPVRTLRFNNTTTDEIFDYTLPTDLLYYDAEHYDEFILDYEGQSCIVNKRVGYNADGTTYVLANETTIEYEYPTIELTEGDYTISLLGYSVGYIFARLMVKNLYTDQFATKAQLNSAITQTKSEINLSVSETYETKQSATSHYSSIDIKADRIEMRVGQVSNRVDGLEDIAVSDVIVEYALGNDTVNPPTTGWSRTSPEWQQGKYMWQRTTQKYANGTTDVGQPTCIAGAKGDTGTAGTGISSTTTSYGISSSPSTMPSSWSSTMPTTINDGDYLWTRTVTDYTDTSMQDTVTYSYARQGIKGDTGASGTSVTVSSIKYQQGNSATTPPTGTWSDTVVSVDAGKYLWTRTTFSDGNIAYGVAKQGQTAYFHIKYAPVQNPTSAQMSETPNKYIGTYVDFTQQDSSNPNDYTWAQFEGSQGPQGQQGIPGVNGQDGTTYYLHIKYSDDGGTTFTGNTGEEPGAYMGLLNDTNPDDSTTPSDYSWSQILGDEGVGIKDNITEYYLSTRDDALEGGNWIATQPEWRLGTYIWTRVKNTLSDGTIILTPAILAEALNKANETAYQANKTAGDAELKVTTTIGEWGLQFEAIDGKAQKANDDLYEYKRIQTDYMRYYKDNNDKGVLELGDRTNDFKAQLTNEKLAFKEGTDEVAYISNKKLFITTAEILDSLILGNFGFTPLSNGSVTFGKIR